MIAQGVRRKKLDLFFLLPLLASKEQNRQCLFRQTQAI